MKTNDICEALYALPGGVVEARRRPVVKPLAIALAGAALLVVDTVAIDSDSGNLDAAMLLCGSTMLLWGLIAATTRLFGEGRTAAAAARHGLQLLAEMPIDPALAALADAGCIEDFQGNWLDSAAALLEGK